MTTPDISRSSLILVDENDIIIGYSSRDACHRGDGVLHRAYSIFIFNSQKELLIQQRSLNKELWPLFWSNSCCSHPRKYENYSQSAHRRLTEETGLVSNLLYLYKFIYQANYKNLGSENEMCAIFIGKSDASVIADNSEINDFKWVSLDYLREDIKLNSHLYTPWFLLEFEQLDSKYRSSIENLFIS